MATFNASEADNYGGNGSAGFFSLKDDKDTARVRFMYNNAEEIKGMSVHEVEIDGKKRYVDCLRTYNQPVENCPFCEAKMKVLAKLFIPLYDEDTGEVKIWDRGKPYIAKLGSLASRYQPLVGSVVEVERNGKKGDTNTDYTFYPQAPDNTTLEDLPELPTVLGGLVLDKSFDELNFYLDNGFFENLDPANADGSIQEELPFNGGHDPNARRNPQNDRRPASNTGGNAPSGRGQTPPQQQRRTPANTNGNNSAPAGRRTPPQQNSRDRF